jgi:hypothetical protein
MLSFVARYGIAIEVLWKASFMEMIRSPDSDLGPFFVLISN